MAGIPSVENRGYGIDPTFHRHRRAGDQDNNDRFSGGGGGFNHAFFVSRKFQICAILALTFANAGEDKNRVTAAGDRQDGAGEATGVGGEVVSVGGEVVGADRAEVWGG